MQKFSIVILVAVLILGGFAAYKYGFLEKTTSVSQENEVAQQSIKGRVIFGVTDAAAEMEGISSILLSVNEVRVHSQTKGWVSISEQARQYDLLALKQSGAVSLLAEANLETGTYDQIRLTVSKVIVTKTGLGQEAKLPSGDLKIVGKIVVEEGKTSSVVVDFLADKSLHTTGTGKFIFAPVVKVESRSDTQVDIGVNALSIIGGKVDTEVTAGMDENGETKAGFVLDAKAKIELVGDALRIISVGESETAVKIAAKTAVSTALSGHLDTALSVKLVTLDGKQAWRVVGTKGIGIFAVYVDAISGTVIKTE